MRYGTSIFGTFFLLWHLIALFETAYSVWTLVPWAPPELIEDQGLAILGLALVLVWPAYGLYERFVMNPLTILFDAQEPRGQYASVDVYSRNGVLDDDDDFAIMPNCRVRIHNKSPRRVLHNVVVKIEGLWTGYDLDLPTTLRFERTKESSCNIGPLDDEFVEVFAFNEPSSILIAGEELATPRPPFEVLITATAEEGREQRKYRFNGASLQQVH